MAPSLLKLKQNYCSNLSTLLTILRNLSDLTDKKGQAVLAQDWEELSSITKDQENLKEYFIQCEKELFSNEVEGYSKIFVNDLEVRTLKDEIILVASNYREKETLVIKMLNDSYFVAKKKIEKLFMRKNQNITYTKNVGKNEKQLINGNSVLVNKLI